MPFKLKLKKSRQYNVSSKNSFVLSVELLDNTTVECTLSSQSLGHECLNNVCQRLNLLQPQYFGLRFLSKKSGYWWVDLQRPLKHQLDKYALDNNSLGLRVMFFVSDVNILHDEVTRYHYFLQLKSDILDGKLVCDEEQTILFASYSLQAEFGDHDPERHTTEYLTNFGLLPKQVAQGKENQEAILERVIGAHLNLQGLSQQLAEVYYIMEAQKLNGYGLECFAAKDNSNNNIVLGVSLMGIYIWYLSSQPTVYFAWDQIINLVHHKRSFGIEHRNSRKALQSYLDDSHIAKYVWKTCIQQHGFYTKNEGIVSSATDQTAELIPPNLGPKIVSRKPSAVKAESRTFRSLQESQDSLDDLGVYHTAGRYSERLTTAKSCSQILFGGSQKELAIPIPLQQSTSSSITALKSVPSQSSMGSTNTSVPQLFAVSSSDVSIHQSRASLPEIQPLDAKPICSVLPTYRQAPDYDTAVKLKYGFQSCSTGDVPTSHLMQHEVNHVQSYSHYNTFIALPELSHLEIHPTPSSMLLRSQEFVSAPTLHPAPHTYSSPDLASQNHISPSSASNTHIVYHYKPPPPYPYKQRSSSSVPDLTANSNVVSSCPSVINPHTRQLNLSSYEPIPITCAKLITSNPIQHQTIASSQNVNSVNNLPVHSYENSPSTVILSNARNSPVQYVSNHISSVHSPEFASIRAAEQVNALYSEHQIQNASSRQMYPFPPAISNRDQIAVGHSAEVDRRSSLQASDQSGVIYSDNGQNCSPLKPPYLTPSCVNEQGKQATINCPIGGVSSKVLTSQSSAVIFPAVSSMPVSSGLPTESPPLQPGLNEREGGRVMGPMLVAAMNGLSLSIPSVMSLPVEETRIPNDSRIMSLESRLAEGQVFLEFERVPKRKVNSDFSTALLPENAPRNRFKDVFPYEENRVRLTPTSENKTGYINASHLSVSLGSMQRFYIAAQGPLPNTLYSFWQMVWEHHCMVIVMLTEVQEQGRDKCFPYWPQEDGNKLQIGEFQIVRHFSMSSPTYVTCSLSLCHVPSHQHRSVWHIQYTDWPDHSCPCDTQGFIAFLSEVDAVRRHASSNHESGPIVIHCSAGVGRSGAVILTDIMLHCLDHNQPIDLPKALTHLRMQRMLTVQTLAQYKFVYNVLIQYLKNSRLI